MGHSQLRRETVSAAAGTYAPDGVTAYYGIYGAVKGEPGLIHGKLCNPHGEHCAIGSYFDKAHTALPAKLIDEVAGVNDSVPHMTPKQRKAFVLRWLKWKLASLGMPGFRTKTNPTTPSATSATKG